MILPFPLCTSQGDFRLDQTYFNTKIVFSIVHEFSESVLKRKAPKDLLSR